MITLKGLSHDVINVLNKDGSRRRQTTDVTEDVKMNYVFSSNRERSKSIREISNKRSIKHDGI